MWKWTKITAITISTWLCQYIFYKICRHLPMQACEIEVAVYSIYGFFPSFQVSMPAYSMAVGADTGICNSRPDLGNLISVQYIWSHLSKTWFQSTWSWLTLALLLLWKLMGLVKLADLNQVSVQYIWSFPAFKSSTYGWHTDKFGAISAKTKLKVHGLGLHWLLLLLWNPLNVAGDSPVYYGKNIKLHYYQLKI